MKHWQFNSIVGTIWIAPPDQNQIGLAIGLILVLFGLIGSLGE